MSSLDTVTIGGPVTAFGEVNVAGPGNRWDCEFIYDKQPLIVDEAHTNSGAAAHQANGRDLLLSITDGTDVAQVRGHYWVPYTPGSGQAIDITASLDTTNIGGGTAYCFLKSTVSGSTVETTIAQSEWINNSSGIDWADSQIFRMQFQSLKVGSIFFFMVSNGSIKKVAEIHNDNRRATGYWQYANMPVYWKLYTSGGNTIAECGYGDDYNGIGFRYVFAGTQATATMRAICSTVKSEGGLPLFDMPGYPFSASETSAVTVSTTEVPIISLQMASTFNSLANRTMAIIESVSIQTDNPVRYIVRYRPSLTGASFGAVNATYSAMNYDTTASAVSGGVVVFEDFAATNKNTPASASGLLGRVIMSLGSTATSDIISVSAIRTSGTDASVLAAIKWREIR